MNLPRSVAVLEGTVLSALRTPSALLHSTKAVASASGPFACAFFSEASMITMQVRGNRAKNRAKPLTGLDARTSGEHDARAGLGLRARRGALAVAARYARNRERGRRELGERCRWPIAKPVAVVKDNRNHRSAQCRGHLTQVAPTGTRTRDGSWHWAAAHNHPCQR